MRRTISPFSKLTVPEWIENSIKAGTLESLRVAIQIDPANARLIAHFGMALANLAVAEETDPAEARRMRAEADFQTGRALKLAPDNDEVKAAIQNNLGNALYGQGIRTRGAEASELLTQAVAAYRSALEVFSNADLPRSRAATQNNLASALWTLGDQSEGEEGLKPKRESIELLRQVVSYQLDDLSRYRLASTLGSLAFDLVLNSQFAEAQTRCEEAQRLANEIGDGVQKSDRDNLIFIQGNRAHALLFQGHYDEALAIYRQYWDKPLNGKTFGEVTLEDFATFDKAGLTHPDLSRMKRALEDLPSKAPSP